MPVISPLTTVLVRTLLGLSLGGAVTPAWAQWSLDADPGHSAQSGSVLGGAYCRDLEIMLTLLDQRAEAYLQAAEALARRGGDVANQAVERARVEAQKTRAEAAPLQRNFALQCDQSRLSAAAVSAPRAPGDGVTETPLGIEIPTELSGTDGWVLMVAGRMDRPWRDDQVGQHVRSELWMYLSDANGLIYAEPVISEVQDGMRFTMRMTCQTVMMASDTAFRFEATVRNFPERRYVAQGQIEVTGAMVIDNGAPAWPVRVRYGFSYQHRGDTGVHFADGGRFEGEGIARRLTDTGRRMQRSTQTLDHACNG